MNRPIGAVHKVRNAKFRFFRHPSLVHPSRTSQDPMSLQVKTTWHKVLLDPYFSTLSSPSALRILYTALQPIGL